MILQGAIYPVDPMFTRMNPVKDESVGAKAKARWKLAGGFDRQVSGICNLA